jgi:chitinase
MNFTVSLAPTVDTTVTVDFQSNDGTATIADNDYVGVVPATLTFLPGIGSQTVSVTINGDTKPEPDEIFTIDLSNAVWATILDNQGQGTIRNDDLVPAVSIADAPAVAEGNSVGASTSIFDVSLDAVSTYPVTVTYQTSDGTAQAGIDYVPVLSGQLVFAPGEDQKTIPVQIVGDTFIDTLPTKDFFVDLTGVVGGTIADNQGRAVINDDDTIVVLPSLSISPASINEGNSGTVTLSFDVTLSAASATPVSVDYATSDGTATAGNDYTAASGTLIFAAGQQAQTVMVTINSDKNKEGDETFTVTLSNPSNATIATASATGTITNDDSSSSGGSSSNDDDDDGDSSPPPPPAAPVQPASSAAPPAAVPAALPVTTLPETGLDGGSTTTMPWFLMVGLGLGAAALVWNGQRRRKNRKP